MGTRERRIGSYGLCRDGGRVLLVRGPDDSLFPGAWGLPGGTVQHAEHPARTLVRRFVEQTGLSVEVGGVHAAVADVAHVSDRAVHTDRVVFEVTVRPGGSRVPSDRHPDVAWCTTAEASRLALLPFVVELLDLPVAPASPTSEPAPVALTAQDRDRGQRFAAYGLVTDPAGRILLTMIAEGYPGAGRWHLPGGGTDHGEQPIAALLRELVEETGQVGRVVEVVDVDNLHNPRAMGPEGRPMDWHSVRVVYRMVVDVPTEAVVTEAAGGSTARAAWFAPNQIATLSLTEVAARLTGR
ncbi:NUDIX domain-containing protein [Micromonospora sp. NPDC000207]|uniref:NUDIX hydrolase n=1 Tax=Micromonospora sp. NPDC000207 TaxID=3154246 RepID=UPI00332BE7C7